MPDQVYNVWWNGTTHMSRSFDGLGRLSSSVINDVLTTNYHYKDIVNTDRTTTQLQSMVTPAGSFTYTYDSLGNITSIFDGTYTLSYEYDSLNQLVRENDQRTGKTYTYTYLNGNILSKKQYVYTTGELGAVVNTINYGYGDSVWKDLLTSYNGMNITYDEIGNMTSFNGRTYSWLGRQLQSINGLATYTYNMDGQRIGKKTSNDDITYYYNGDILAGEKNGNTVTFFMYDENGDYIGFNYAGINYYYIKNAQNDVIAIANSSGNVITSYTYDSWGKLISITGNYIIGYQNPIRYRSYYYDNESGLYYLQSRYYNPEIGRFISIDGIISDVGNKLTGNNMYCYCLNNPIVFYDPVGLWTVCVMVTSNANFGVGLGGAIGVAFDDSGLYEYQYSYSALGINDSFSIGGIDAGVGLSIQITQADSVRDLHGIGTSVGGAVGSGGYFGIDGITLNGIYSSMNRDDQTFDGVQFTVGYGVGVDVHVNQTYTNSIGNSNGNSENVNVYLCAIFEYIENVFSPILNF